MTDVHPHSPPDDVITNPHLGRHATATPSGAARPLDRSKDAPRIVSFINTSVHHSSGVDTADADRLVEMEGSGDLVDSVGEETEPSAPPSPQHQEPLDSVPLHGRTHSIASTASTTNSEISRATSINSSTGSMASARRAGVSTLQCGNIKIKVPFTAWTFLAMIVPIGLLVAVLSIGVAATVKELDTVDEHKDLASAVGECSSWLMRERGTMGPWIARGDASDFTNLERVRMGVDMHCGMHLANEMRRLSAESDEWAGQVNRHVQLLRDLSTWRERVNTRIVNGRLAREFFTASITATAESLILVADMLDTTQRAFAELRLTIGSRNFIGLARGVGNAIAASDPTTTTASAPVVHEYIAGHAQAQMGYVFLQGMSGTRLRERLSGWERSEEAARMWWLLDKMADVSNGGVLYIQQNNATVWWAVVSAGLDALFAVEQAHLAELQEAAEAKGQVRDAGLIMGFGTLACLVAAGLLAWRQTQVRAQLEAQVARIERTKRAVSAFVPRFFLHKMGYTSITQVRAGESTNVALAMLFSDIRHFTTVSEGMHSDELFEWIQGYFQRMTSIVEGRRGNVNQFVGDALFAVFSTCHDSLQCAIDMQADVQQLNVERLRNDERIIPIDVGVGIHHDVVALGILGDDKRHTCTAISASVNLASRLEGLTKQLGCKIIASDAVVSQLSAQQAAGMRIRKVGGVVVKGSAAAVVVHDVFHADARELQLYKGATREAFEELARECLHHEPSDEVHRALKAELRAYVTGLSGAADSVMSHAGASISDQRVFNVLQSPAAAKGALQLSNATHQLATPAADSHVSSTRDAPVEMLPIHLAPPVVDLSSGVSDDSALQRLMHGLREYRVRDYAIEAVAALSDGSGSLRFALK